MPRLLLIVQFTLLVAFGFHSNAAPENMDDESSIFYQQVLDTIQETLSKTIKDKVGALATRQANFEEFSSKTLAALSEQIADLGRSISNTQT